jgi:NADH:ubiquinone oxidoreductase subunit 5 (subunit L)/multisubunit Na+/H+ antiporter MnhA subunit
MSFKYYVQNISELPINMGFSLFILALGSIFSGWLLKDLFIGFGNIAFGNSIYKSACHNTFMDIEFIPLYIKNLPLIFSFSGIFLAIILNFSLQYFTDLRPIKNYNNTYVEYPQSYVAII